MASPICFTDFKLGDKLLSDFNGTLYNSEDANIINLAPSITHITEELANQDGQLYFGSRIEPRTIDLSVYFEGDFDLQELGAWLCKKEPQKFQFVDDDKEISVIYNSSIDIRGFYNNEFQGTMDLSFIAYDPYFRIVNEKVVTFTKPSYGNKLVVKSKGNVDSFPLIKIKPNGTQSKIRFKFNDMLIVLQNVDKEIYLDCELEEVYEMHTGRKVLVREKFFSTDYYEFPILTPFISNTIELLEGNVAEITVLPNSRVL